MRVRPAQPGAMIRDPHTRRPLPEEGGTVSDSNFWRRRLRDGDVVMVEGDDGPVPPEHAPVGPLATRRGTP